MATIRTSIPIARPAPAVWAAIADVGAVHTRLARGFVTDTRLEGDTRVVTFEGGTVARELIVSVDDADRRIAYAVVESPLGLRHHHATMHVVPSSDDGAGTCRLEWVADVFPDEAAATISGMMDIGAAAMQRTLSSIETAHDLEAVAS
jgi:hypothetical protein